VVEKENKMENSLWIERRLTEKAMIYLWDLINNSPKEIPEKNSLRQLEVRLKTPTIFLQDKDNWFYENVLKECVDHLYLQKWNNYYEVVVTKSRPAPIFLLNDLWVNYQKQHEFISPHGHGSEFFSFVIFMKIPCVSDFSFLLGHGNGEVQPIPFPLCPEDEGRMLFFPAWLFHQVFPFYGTEEERISVAGNIGIAPPVLDENEDEY